MVVYEAARAMVNLKNVTAKEVQPSVSGACVTKAVWCALFRVLSYVAVLQMFLTSTKPTIRFAAVKTLNKVSENLVDVYAGLPWKELYLSKSFNFLALQSPF